MLECCWGASMSRCARLRAGETLFRERAGEIVAAVVRQAEAGDRAAMRLARRYALPIGPTPEVLAARLAETIARTRATVATLLAEGRATSAPRAPAHPSSARVIALSDAKPDVGRAAPCRSAMEGTGKLVNNKESTRRWRTAPRHGRVTWHDSRCYSGENENSGHDAPRHGSMGRANEQVGPSGDVTIPKNVL